MQIVTIGANRIALKKVRLLTADLSVMKEERDVPKGSSEERRIFEDTLHELKQLIWTRTGERDEAMEEARRLTDAVHSLTERLRRTSEEMRLEIEQSRNEKDQLKAELQAMVELLRVPSGESDISRRRADALEDVLGNISAKIKHASSASDRASDPTLGPIQTEVSIQTEVQRTIDRPPPYQQTAQDIETERIIKQTVAGLMSSLADVQQNTPIANPSSKSASLAALRTMERAFGHLLSSGSAPSPPAMAVPVRRTSTSDRPEYRTAPGDSEQTRFRTLTWPAYPSLHAFTDPTSFPSMLGANRAKPPPPLSMNPRPPGSMHSMSSSNPAKQSVRRDVFEGASTSTLPQLPTPEHSPDMAGPSNTALASTARPPHADPAEIRAINRPPLTAYPSHATVQDPSTSSQQTPGRVEMPSMDTAAGRLEHGVRLASDWKYRRGRSDEKSRAEWIELDRRLRAFCKRWPDEEQAWRNEAKRRDGEQAVQLLQWCAYLHRREDEASKKEYRELQARLQVYADTWPEMLEDWTMVASQRNSERRRADSATGECLFSFEILVCNDFFDG